MTGWSGESARARWARTRSSSIMARRSSSVELLDLRHLVRGAEAVEEVQERHARLERGGLGDQREVHRLPAPSWRRACAKPVARAAITSLWSPKIERACVGERARGDVEDRGGQLARDLVHVRDHQQQALRGGEGGRERAALQRAVDRAGRAALALHLDHRGHGAPEVRAAFGRPLVGPLAHGGGRRDRVDGDDFAQLVRDAGGRLVAVDRDVHGRRPAQWAPSARPMTR